MKLEPTKTRRRGEINPAKEIPKKSTWQLSTKPGKEYLDINMLITEIITQVKGKETKINQIKEEQSLSSRLQFVIYIDINKEKSTPYLGFHMDLIEFLYNTKTETDFDIYRVDSTN